MHENIDTQKLERLMQVLFPSLNPDILKSRIEKFIEGCEDNLEDDQ
jgi:hypothetical protein